MAADGQADPEEMRVIRTVADSLGLDMDEIESMREKVTLNLSTELSGEDGLESLVGIQAEWTSEEKKKHLRNVTLIYVDINKNKQKNLKQS